MIAMMRPVMPILEYYANYDYVATVLCENRDKPALACNGKCYLQKQMQKVSQPASHKNHQHDSSLPQIDFSKYPVAPITENQESLRVIKLRLHTNWNTYEGEPKNHISLVFRPPLNV